MIKIFHFFKKNLKKQHVILIGIGLVLLLTGIISWNVYFSKFYIFAQQEKYFSDTVKDYYQYHSIYLPKEGNVKTITLEELYEMGRIDTLYSPKSYKLCDTNSWVKVYNDGNEYHYYVYLKCEKFETNVDHEGPVITLNGDDTIYVSLNRVYEELGVAKVIDNVDGDIEITKVTIDNSKVNTKKVGQYNVTYTVRDTLNNETVVTRKVIVTRNLTDVVRDATNDSNYYQGGVENNYLLFSGMMYRIINVNEDGTVTLISNEILNNLRIDSTQYENSNIDKFLTEVYLPIIYNSDYIVDADYCVDDINELNSDSTCAKTVKRKISLLNLHDFYQTFQNGVSFLCNNFSYALTNYSNGKNVNAFIGGKNCIDTIESADELPAIRPVLTLKSNLIVLSGDGTKANPYKLNDYSYGKQQDKINTRLIGEYVNYSGNVFRIIDIVGDNVRMIAVDGLQKNNVNYNKTYLTLSVPNGNYMFNLSDTDNLGYILNNQYLDYINDSYIVSNDYEIPTNEVKNYNSYHLDTVKAKMVLPKTYDFFSGVQTLNGGYMYLYLDYSLNENQVFNVNIINGKVFEDQANLYGDYCFKPVITIRGDLKIKSGKGTVSNPYYINK